MTNVHHLLVLMHLCFSLALGTWTFVPCLLQVLALGWLLAWTSAGPKCGCTIAVVQVNLGFGLGLEQVLAVQENINVGLGILDLCTYQLTSGTFPSLSCSPSNSVLTLAYTLDLKS
jgi:hypothetical protein